MTSQNRPRVLVVEDDPDLRELMAEALGDDGFAVTQAADAGSGLSRIRRGTFEAIVIDLRLPDGNGMRVLDQALDRHPDIVPVVVSGEGGLDEAVAAIKRGAHDFLVKPFGLSQLAAVLRTGLGGPTAAEEEPAPAERARFTGVIGDSPAMEKMFSTLGLVSPLDTTVLLHGETGTGKELIARTIHTHSPRADESFVAFNAAAIPEGLAETELFGHTKGAFTGAVSSRVGRFEQAHGGTLFIDEVALMPLALQSKLLRALQEREVERLGESSPIRFDARVIAATSADLPQMVQDGEFRQDLFYRLNVVRVTVPPLRQRLSDVPALADHFLRTACRRLGLPTRRFSPDALVALEEYDWPGNVRELENAVEHAAALSGAGGEITRAELPADVLTGARTALLPDVTIPEDGLNLTAFLGRIEQDLIAKTLERTGGNKRQAAKLLKVSRTTLIDKINRLSRGRSGSGTPRS